MTTTPTAPGLSALQETAKTLYLGLCQYKIEDPDCPISDETVGKMEEVALAVRDAAIARAKANEASLRGEEGK